MNHMFTKYFQVECTVLTLLVVSPSMIIVMRQKSSLNDLQRK